MSDSTPPLLKLWKKFNGSAPQRGLFSLGYALKAPYFRTVAPRVREVEPGRAVLRLGKWWGVQNHIGTFHVIAALNGAEAAMGLVCEATVPTTHRWIPRGMRADYPAKSTGGLTITATLDDVDFSAITRESGGELHTIWFQMLDDAGVEPVTAEIDVWITAKKPR
ncbi:MAG: hotdog fold domain-containing protein [Corynebacterium variabile]